MNKIIISIVTACLISATPAFAKNEQSAIYSPNCSQADIKEITGDALVNISKNQEWGDNVQGFIINLNIDKMSYAELAKAMQKKGCFN